MKAQFTASGTTLIQSVESKLLTPFSERCTFFFSIFPSLGAGHFSIQFLEDEQPFLIARQWNGPKGAAYPLGVYLYNLNNIRIEERKILLSSEQCAFISSIKEMEIRIEELDGIMLDGEYFQLILGDRKYDWRMMYQVSPELQTALTKLIDWAGFSR